MRYVLTTGTHCEQDFNTLEIPLGQLVMLALLSEANDVSSCFLFTPFLHHLLTRSPHSVLCHNYTNSRHANTKRTPIFHTKISKTDTEIYYFFDKKQISSEKEKSYT